MLSLNADFSKLLETRIIPRTGDPVWNEEHTVAVAHDVEEILLLVKDNDRLSVEHVAEVRHPAQGTGIRLGCTYMHHVCRHLKLQSVILTSAHLC